MNNLKIYVMIFIGAIGSVTSKIIGGWTNDAITLLYCMLADLTLGVIISLLFRKSPKTQSGGINSNIFIKGFFKKICMLIMVGVGFRMDILLGLGYIRTGVVLSLILNEIISITENIGIMGVPLPKKLKNAIDILQKKEGE